METKNHHLPEKLSRTTKKHHDRENKKKLGRSIEERDPSVNDRKEFGHWESDLVIGQKSGKDKVLLTLAERKSREYWMIPLVNREAATILEAAGRDEEGKTHVAYGTIVKEIKEVSRSYKEARMAMDVGKIFSAENDIYAYSSLGIGRLIYQLPIPLCKMFIKEIFGNKSPDDFDEETLTTINKFFENSLNVSETSRQLYIHRNTLVYRLDKLQKSTGLDLRVFEDAITFKIALMVVQYMKYMETLDY